MPSDASKEDRGTRPVAGPVIAHRTEYFMARALLFRLLLTLAVSAFACFLVFAPAAAAPTTDTQRITITLISDHEHNGAAAWTDADGRLRIQSEVPLSQRDPDGKFSASLVYTRAMGEAPVDALFQSGGRFARCEITVDGERVADHTAHGSRPTSSCHSG
ncbi:MULTISPECIES: hypothetical protein [Gordonia]|uniref:hypothetical protein n=1 Tax=Gordonia TaxID=2053 RepID=UPI001CFA36C9|nr:hypothetical protein [Gordonia sp. WA4-43]UCZ89976.1 hypothetical protein LEL84_23770 [Gordonia sp. WA4-43]